MPDQEQNSVDKALQNARPSWFGPQPRARGIEFIDTTYSRNVVDRRPRSTRSHYQAPFPEATSTTTTPESVSTANNNESSFELEVDKIDRAAGTVRIHVGYGEINDTPPTGMTGADDYYFTISVDGTEIWAVITYDTATLAITSRNLDFGSSVPDSSFGTLIVPIGFVDIAYDPHTGKIKEVNPHNRHIGDINFAMIYGSVNGVASIIPLFVAGDWTAVT